MEDHFPSFGIEISLEDGGVSVPCPSSDDDLVPGDPYRCHNVAWSLA